jgi:pimeloyl-ACP methyl ester carboxylesterase
VCKVVGHRVLHLAPRNQLVHPFQKDLAACFALLVLVLGFGKGYLAHGGSESYAVSDGTIIADFGGSCIQCLHARVGSVTCPVLWIHGTAAAVYSVANAEDGIGRFSQSADGQLKSLMAVSIFERI